MHAGNLHGKSPHSLYKFGLLDVSLYSFVTKIYIITGHVVSMKRNQH